MPGCGQPHLVQFVSTIYYTDPLEIREEGKRNKTYNKAAKSRKRFERRKSKEKKRFQNNVESRKQHIKNLSNTQLTDEQISLLSRGLKFIPTPVTRENIIRHQLLNDFSQFSRRMRLKYIFHGNDKEPHPFHVKSDWDPPVQPSVALETFAEEVKFDLANIKFNKPKDNLSLGERNALKELSRDENIVLRKADKGTTTVIMNKTDKLYEGQVQLDDVQNYRPLDRPIVETTAKKVHRLTQSLLHEGHIHDMTAKRLSLTLDPPRMPVFYTLTKIHKPTPVGRPIISGCDGPTERISAFDHLIQPVAQIRASYLRDTTDFLNIQSLSQWKSPASTRIYRRRRVLLLYAKHTKFERNAESYSTRNLVPIQWKRLPPNSWSSHGYENGRSSR